MRHLIVPIIASLFVSCATTRDVDITWPDSSGWPACPVLDVPCPSISTSTDLVRRDLAHVDREYRWRRGSTEHLHVDDGDFAEFALEVVSGLLFSLIDSDATPDLSVLDQINYPLPATGPGAGSPVETCCRDSGPYRSKGHHP